jgi:hypothetical protein
MYFNLGASAPEVPMREAKMRARHSHIQAIVAMTMEERKCSKKTQKHTTAGIR